MRWRVVTPPTARPVSLDAAKRHLRVDVSDDDAHITVLIDAASVYVEEISGLSLTPRVIEAYLPTWPAGGWLLLPRPPVSSVAWVRYIDATGATQTAQGYVVDERGVWASAWPAVALSRDVPDAITVRYTAGYEAAPAPLRHAVLLLVGHWYEHREAAEVGHISRDVAFGVDALVAPYRRWT